MNLLSCILTANDCYKTGRTITPKGVMVHSTGANNPLVARYVQPLEGDGDYDALIAAIGYNRNQNDWNRGGLDVCTHAFVGKLANGSVGAVQTLPWNHRGWHAGTGTSGGSANNTHIAFEICEDNLTDGDYFAQSYQTAVELTAMLCKKYGLDPLADGVVICHAEGYARGIASNHADVNHWFPKFGKSMDDFRRDVAQAMGESDKEPDADSLYRVQVGAFAVKGNAEAMKAKVEAAGFDTYMVQAGALYKVQVGAFAVKDNAEAMLARVKSAGFEAYITTESGQAAPTSRKVKVIAKDGLNCRSGPGTGYKVLKAYVYGATLTISKEQSGWGYTGEGWVSLEFVSKLDTAAPTSRKVTVIAKDGLNCRSGPGTGNPVVKAYPYGTTLTITKEQSGWGYTGEGWVSLEHVK